MPRYDSLGWLLPRKKWQLVNHLSDVRGAFSTTLYIKLVYHEKLFGLRISLRVHYLKMGPFSISHMWSENPILTVWELNWNKSNQTLYCYWETTLWKRLLHVGLSRSGVVVSCEAPDDSMELNASQHTTLLSLLEACSNGSQSLLTWISNERLKNQFTRIYVYQSVIRSSVPPTPRWLNT